MCHNWNLVALYIQGADETSFLACFYARENVSQEKIVLRAITESNLQLHLPCKYRSDSVLRSEMEISLNFQGKL